MTKIKNWQCYKHGHFSNGKMSPTYVSWRSMMNRMTNPNTKDYESYSKKGIKMDLRWKDFRNFLADMGERPSREYSIDRINTYGNYEPGNCRWATIQQQGENKRNILKISHEGKSLTRSQWAREKGFKWNLIHQRLYQGWSEEDAINLPCGRGLHTSGSSNKSSKLTEEKVLKIRRLREKGLTLVSIAKKFGVSFGIISRIVNRDLWKCVK